MSSRFEQTNADEAVPTSDRTQKFKADAGKRYRVCFPLKSANGSVSIIKVPYFPFHEGLKKSFLTTENQDLNSQVSKIMGEAKTKWVTPIMIYDTDKNGTPIVPPRYEVLPFVFADGVLQMLQQVKSAGHVIAEIDFFISLKDGTDPKFQNLVFTPCTTGNLSAWGKSDKAPAKKAYDEVMTEVKAVSEVMHQAVAMDATETQIRQWLGLTANAEALPENPMDAYSAPAEFPEDGIPTGGDAVQDGWV